MSDGIFTLPVDYPGTNRIPTMFTLRTIGSVDSGETFGAGFIHKDGPIDVIDYTQNHYALIYVIRGEGEYVDEQGKRYGLSKGTFFQRFPYRVHATYVKPGSRWIEAFLAIGEHLYKSLKVMGVLKEERPVFRASLEGDSIEREFYSLTRRVHALGEDNILSFLTDELSVLRQFLQIYPPSSDPIEQACAFFNRYPEKRISIIRYCKEHGIGYEWFRKEFRQRMGISPASYAIMQRLNLARNLIKTSNTSLGRIAEMLGYNNQFELSAQFKKQFGLAPRKYRDNPPFPIDEAS